MLLDGLKGLFGFLTIFPVGMGSMEALSKYFFLCPIVGIVIGSLAGIIGMGLDFLLPSSITGFVVLVVVQFLTGFHHLDGLLDFSDAAMARGDSKRRLEIMHDMFTGAAAVGSGVIVLILTGLSFGAFQGSNIFVVAVIAEVMAKESMVLMAYFGNKPNYEGSGYYVVESMNKKHVELIGSLILSSIVGYILINFWFILIIIVMSIVVGILTFFSNKTIKFVT